MSADTYVVSVSYTHLAPYRRHILFLDTLNKQVRLISDPRERSVSDSGWHGSHTWYQGAPAFVLDDFNYDGERVGVYHRMVFTLDGFSANWGHSRYTGQYAGGPRGFTGNVAEVVFQAGAAMVPRMVTNGAISELALSPTYSNDFQLVDSCRRATTLGPSSRSGLTVYPSVASGSRTTETILSLRAPLYGALQAVSPPPTQLSHSSSDQPPARPTGPPPAPHPPLTHTEERLVRQ